MFWCVFIFDFINDWDYFFFIIMLVLDFDDIYFKISRFFLIIVYNLVFVKIIFFWSKVYVFCWYFVFLFLYYIILGIVKERWCYEVF